ncbi:MAG: RecX family transcriptional regulator [Prolixibacteraceae bacterium]|nr:RecX family transcriptional regulator [Prolixibacteraceae bacterium]
MESEKLTTKQAFARAADLCSKSEKSSPEMKKKLMEWGLDKYDAEAVVEELKQEKFIDDDRYVKAYVRDKFKIGKWGRIKIRYYCRQKGLPGDLIETGLKEIEEESYVKLLLQTMSQKAKSINSKNRFDRMARIIRFTQNRGFEPEYIHRHLNEVVKD